MPRTVLLGTFSLSDLCDCPDPCPDCCDVDNLCCTGVPRTLHATVHSSPCSAFVIVLTYSGGVWTGSGTVGCSTDGFTCNQSVTLTVTLACIVVSGIPVWDIKITCDGTHFFETNPPASVSCSPFQVVFTVAAPVGCSGCIIPEITVTA